MAAGRTAPAPAGAVRLPASIMEGAMHRMPFAVVAAAAVLLACHPQSQRLDDGSSMRNVITQGQIDSTGASNIYDVITRLRAEFLKDRGRISLKTNQHERAVVFLNDQENGIPEPMRNIPPGRISEIRYFTGTEAASKFGSQYGG